jgi:hypothetical protein
MANPAAIRSSTRRSTEYRVTSGGCARVRWGSAQRRSGLRASPALLVHLVWRHTAGECGHSDPYQVASGHSVAQVLEEL